MHEVDLSADQLVREAIRVGDGAVCLLDSCGVGRAGSNLLIAGVRPVRTVSLASDSVERSLEELDRILYDDRLAAIFTLSYDFGLALNGIPITKSTVEPHLFAALFDSLAIHDYELGRTWLAGNKTDDLENILSLAAGHPRQVVPSIRDPRTPTSNFSRDEYLNAVEQVKEFIRDGETYQTNLTQQLTVGLPDGGHPADVFLDLRSTHPAAFAAYLERGDSTVISASPEQFIRLETHPDRRKITASPIKGTRPRGSTPAEDLLMRRELLTSEKDRAENTMIVDLMRNDLGRICEFGSVEVSELCRIEEHPTLFHLGSTVTGTLREGARYSDVIRAVFPCGSITGAPKIRTMELIDRIEKTSRGLSMGAIGCRIPGGVFGTAEIFEMSVAIRTMVVRDGIAVFNVGGGVVIDSDPANEYEESMLKAKALLRALGAVREAAWPV